MFKIGFIDYYLDEWHANNYPKFFKECAGDEMEVAYAYGEIASVKSGKTSKEWCEEHGVQLCETIEEIVEKSDGLIILSPDNPERKEDLSKLAMMSGKPCIIDKTFTTGYESGKRLFDLAQKYNTPVYTTSALRYAPDYKQVDNKEVTSINFFGPNDFNNYSIHLLEPLMSIVKTNAKKVMYTLSEGFYMVNIELDDGRPVSISGYMNGRFPFMAAVAGREKEKNFIVKVEQPFWPIYIEAACEFFRTKKPMVDHKESLAIMAIRTAAIEAMKKPGEWVEVENKVF